MWEVKPVENMAEKQESTNYKPDDSTGKPDDAQGEPKPNSIEWSRVSTQDIDYEKGFTWDRLKLSSLLVSVLNEQQDKGALDYPTPIQVALIEDMTRHAMCGKPNVDPRTIIIEALSGK